MKGTDFQLFTKNFCWNETVVFNDIFLFEISLKTFLFLYKVQIAFSKLCLKFAGQWEIVQQNGHFLSSNFPLLDKFIFGNLSYQQYTIEPLTPLRIFMIPIHFMYCLFYTIRR